MSDLELVILQPRPFELRAVLVGRITYMDERARSIADWVNGKLHTGTDGNYLEWWQREPDGVFLTDRERYEAREGQAIVEWPDGTFQVVWATELEGLYLRVGTEIWINGKDGRNANRQLLD